MCLVQTPLKLPLGYREKMKSIEIRVDIETLLHLPHISMSKPMVLAASTTCIVLYTPKILRAAYAARKKTVRESLKR